MNWTEIAGFVTGAVCVWLVVIRNIWNFPVGIANYAFFFVLFAQSAALVVPNSLPNGLNGAGLVTSNGIRTYISEY